MHTDRHVSFITTISICLFLLLAQLSWDFGCLHSGEQAKISSRRIFSSDSNPDKNLGGKSNLRSVRYSAAALEKILLLLLLPHCSSLVHSCCCLMTGGNSSSLLCQGVFTHSWTNNSECFYVEGETSAAAAVAATVV